MTRRAATPRAAAAVLLAAALAGCAGGGHYPARPAPETLAAGSPLLSESLGPTDAWLRHYLMTGKADSALALLRQERVAPRDDLLRHLQLGVVLHHAGEWAESNAAFEWAEGEAERRYTRSVSQTAGMLLVNDGVVAYTPPPAEMAMIPYYRMLNYLALENGAESVVEARKANAYLERIRQGAGEPCVGEGFVQYLTGLVYDGAGERRDALVSYRQAERGYDACSGGAAPAALGADLYRAARAAGVADVADSAAARYRVAGVAVNGAGTGGELVVLVEQGWVAHRAPTDIHLPIPRDEMDALESGDAGLITEAAGRLSAHLLGNVMEQAQWGSTTDERFQLADAASGAYIMKMAWPSSRLEACAPRSVRLVVDGDTVEPPASASDLSAAVTRRWDAQRPGMLSRMVARGLAKYVMGRAAERKAEKQGGEMAGWLAGRVANLAGNALERADTRSWSLLPDRIAVSRLTLPPGPHDIRIEVLNADGTVAQTVDLGRVTLEAGSTRILHRRVWGGEMGGAERLVHTAPRP
ncbi:MAG TPA: hypothetical protein VF625_10455 [Longimicrobium sp.]|jgi:hypothetical protein